jgi:hypothetical protein
MRKLHFSKEYINIAHFIGRETPGSNERGDIPRRED